MASCHRLLDIVDLVESDARVQTVFTVAPDVFNAGVAAHLERLGALVVPWQQAVREPFDLAIAASHGGLHELHAPVMLVAHGAGRSRLVRPPAFGGLPVAEPSVYGLDAPRLVRDGRVVAGKSGEKVGDEAGGKGAGYADWVRQVNECVPVEELRDLAALYRSVLEEAFA